MPDPFDPYREALVVEELTLWSPDARSQATEWEPRRRRRFERLLHAEPDAATELNYVRVHTGFCRQITAQPNDINRLRDRLQGDQPPKTPSK